MMAVERIGSPNRYSGRARPIRVGVLHTAQVPCRPGRARGVLLYLSNPTVRASAHWATDPDATIAGVDEADTAWATPSVNADGVQIEQAGYAEFGSGARIPGRMGDRDGYEAARQAYGEGAIWPSWGHDEPVRMLLDQVVPLVADISLRHGLPLVVLEPADIAAGARGWTDHHRCSLAFGGDHWDCGWSYPLHDVIKAARSWTPNAPARWSTPAAAGEQTPAAAIHRLAQEAGVYNVVRTKDNPTMWLVRPSGKAPLLAVLEREAGVPPTEVAVGLVLDGLAEARQLVPHEDNEHSHRWGFVTWEALAVIEWHPGYRDLAPA